MGWRAGGWDQAVCVQLWKTMPFVKTGGLVYRRILYVVWGKNPSFSDVFRLGQGGREWNVMSTYRKESDAQGRRAKGNRVEKKSGARKPRRSLDFVRGLPLSLNGTSLDRGSCVRDKLEHGGCLQGVLPSLAVST